MVKYIDSQDYEQAIHLLENFLSDTEKWCIEIRNNTEEIASYYERGSLERNEEDILSCLENIRTRSEQINTIKERLYEYLHA